MDDPSACCRVRLADDFPFSALIGETVPDLELHREDAAPGWRDGLLFFSGVGLAITLSRCGAGVEPGERGDHCRPFGRGGFGCRSSIHPFTARSAAALLATVLSHTGSSRRLFASAHHTAKRYRPSRRALILYLKPLIFLHHAPSFPASIAVARFQPVVPADPSRCKLCVPSIRLPG